MEPIVNESNRLLFQAFVSIAKQYAAIDEQYRSTALEKSSKVIANYPDEITNCYQLKGIPGIGMGTMRRITIFLKNGQIKIQDHEYTRAAVAKRTRESPVNPRIIDLLVPSAKKYSKVIIPKSDYKYMTETEYHYVFSNVL
jgi:DNA polymerase/3'-5' exonuclease PolX